MCSLARLAEWASGERGERRGEERKGDSRGHVREERRGRYKTEEERAR